MFLFVSLYQVREISKKETKMKTKMMIMMTNDNDDDEIHAES